MKNKIYLLYWLLAFLSVGCYDDKGNNDYRFVNTIEVEPFGRIPIPGQLWEIRSGINRFCILQAGTGTNSIWHMSGHLPVKRSETNLTWNGL